MPKEVLEITGLAASLQKTPIAIVGMASIFPKAENLEQYWDNIIREVDCITEVPPSRWNSDDYFDPDPAVPDKTYCKRGGFIPDIDFNPMEFGLPPNILEVTDVSQLLSLVVAKEAMNDAGYGPAREFNRARTGVILGVGGGQKLITPLTTRLQYPIWDRVLASSGIPKADRDKIIEKMKLAYIPWEENSFPGMLGNVIAGRIANRLDLGGTNCVVDAACAASLAAVKMAISELVEHHADTMITGGVDTDNSIFMYMSFSKTPAFSQQQEIKPFDADSDGMMIGEGIGMVVLKRLADAERDHDRIYAVIRGLGSSSDGKFKSIYAPRSSGQALAINRAYQEAGFAPESVGLVEAHGTGTPAGDPTEFAGLTEVFAQNNPKKQQIALGSVKSQIGHTKAAAGAASLIKTALALHHKVLPPTLNVAQPHPKLNIEDSPFYLNTKTRPWIRAESAPPRRAGVSAFGFGGTNFHIVLEEYTAEHRQAYRLQVVPQPIFVSAPTPAQLLARCQEQLAQLQSDPADQAYQSLSEASASPKIPVSAARVGFVAGSPAEARDMLQIAVTLLQKNGEAAWEHPKGIYYRPNGLQTDGRVVALFPGQGSQYLEMGEDLAVNFPPIRQAYSQIDSLFMADRQEPLSRIVFPIPGFDPAGKAAQAKTLEQTQYAQPAIGAFSFGLYKLLQQAGFKPDFAAGHSFGELTALWAGGVISDADYFFLIKARGEAMAPPIHPNFDAGTMLAVKGNVKQLQTELARLPDVTIANLNSHDQVVLAGPKPAVQQARQQLETAGYVVTPLPVSAAFHTPLVGHAQQPFAHAIERVRFNRPTIPVYSNSTGQPHANDPQLIKETLEEHILKPVLFQEEIENIYAAGGTIFVEIGPRSVLTNLVKSILGDRPHVAVALNASAKKAGDRQLREAFVQLCVAGLPLTAIDPYQAKRESAAVGKKAAMTVKLNGNNYVSEKTSHAFEAALQDGHRVAATVEAAPAPGPVAAAVRPIAVSETPALKASHHNGRQHQTVSQAVNAGSSRSVSAPQAAPVTTTAAAAPVQNSSRQMPAPPSIPRLPLAHLPQVKTTSNGVAHSSSNGVAHRAANGVNHRVDPQTPGNSNGKTNGHTQTSPDGSMKPSTSSKIQQNSDFLPPQQQSLKSLEHSLTLLHQHQAETLRVHEAYLKNQEAYAHSVFSLMEQYYSTLPAEAIEEAAQAIGHPPAPAAPPAPLNVQSRPPVPAVPAEQSPAPENKAQPEPAVPAPKTVPVTPEIVAQPEPAPARPAPEPQPVAPEPQATAPEAGAVSPAAAELAEAMLAVVSEKTGYPAEMLELSMDMEADLGIDSIKRVEILGAMEERYPDLPPVNPEELAELRTLGQIVAHMQGQNGAGTAAAPAVEPVVSAPQVATPAPQATAPEAGAVSPAAAELAEAMLAVVSEKTGYPAEMLELSMDMEADLGIDSIKRVEILGAMEERYPDLPPVNPEELAELRTLGQIVAHMQGQNGAGTAAAPAVEQAAPATPAPQATAPEAGAVSPAAAELAEAMLAVVSEKTGYPAEMLELSMDMEADLGIDSIKRVEILGAMEERYPDLPPVNPEELAELRTLGQIVAHMQGQNGAGTAAAPAVEPVAPATPAPQATAPEAGAVSPAAAELAEAMLAVVSEKTGYPAEMLELSMDMEADLGIDSIKRVEILGAMEERYPDLPPINPEELAELRTLGGIVDVLGKFEPAAVGAGTTVTNDLPAGTDQAISSAVVRFKPLPAPDFLEFALPEGHICLLTDDGSAHTVYAVQTLVERGWPVVVLSLPQTIAPQTLPLPAGVTRIALETLDETHLAQKLAAITTDFGPVGAFIHLSPALASDQTEAAKAVVKQVFFIAKHLKAALTEAARRGRACFMTVVRLDGALGLSDALDFNPIQGGLFGLTKTLNLEWPQVFCRAVDLHPGIAPEQSGQYLLAELHDPNRLVAEVGYGQYGRVTLTADDEAVSGNLETSPKAITPASVFVVSGGGKGITAQCVIRLARQYRCKFILLGRSALDEVDASWAPAEADEATLKRQIMDRLLAQGEKPTPVRVQQLTRAIISKQEIESTLHAIRQAGGQAEYLSVDVTDAAALSRALTAAAGRFGPVTGIIHGAGVLSDKLIEKKTEQDFEAVYSTKVAGLQALLASVPPQQLEQLVLFSSAAGFYGNTGQADYALANEILNKQAHLLQRRYPACRVISINWGPWDGGMVTPALKRLFDQRHIDVIPVEVGTAMLAAELDASRHGVVQTVVGGPLSFPNDEPDAGLQSYRIHRFLSVAANPFLRDHVIGGQPVLPTVNAIAWMGNVCEQLYPGYRMFSCDNYQVLKGIVFDEAGDDSRPYTLDLAEIEKSGERVAFQAVIWRMTADGKTRYHYRAEITLLRELPEAPVYEAFDLTERDSLSQETLYQGGALFHGPSFQGVERVLNISPQKLTMRCRLPKLDDAQQGQFQIQTFNPFIADGQYQSLVIWARHFYQAGSLPLQAGRGEQYRPIPFGETSYVSMVVKSSSETRLVADIFAHDGEGRIYNRVLDAEVTISSQLNRLFVPASPVGVRQ